MNGKSLYTKTTLLTGSLLMLASGLPISANCAENPFVITDLPSGYQLAHKGQEDTPAKDDKNEPVRSKKHHGDEKENRGHDSKSQEGKCGASHMKENEGKCGGMK